LDVGKRLYARYCHLHAKGKRTCQVVIAVARELCGFIWAIAHAASPQPAL